MKGCNYNSLRWQNNASYDTFLLDPTPDVPICPSVDTTIMLVLCITAVWISGDIDALHQLSLVFSLIEIFFFTSIIVEVVWLVDCLFYFRSWQGSHNQRSCLLNIGCMWERVNPLPQTDIFWHLCSRWLLKKLWHTEENAHNESTFATMFSPLFNYLSHIYNRLSKIGLCGKELTLYHTDVFRYLCSRWLLKTLLPQKKILKMRNFYFCHTQHFHLYSVIVHLF